MENEMSVREHGMVKPPKIRTKGKVIQKEDDLEEGEPLTPGSVIFHRPDFNIHLLAITGCKTPINVEYAKSKLPQTLLKHPRFSSIVVGDPDKDKELKWVRTEVELDKHIIVPEIDTSKIESPQKFVDDYIYNLSKTTLDKSRPLWEVHVLKLKVSEDVEGIGIWRMHHSLGDGISLVSLLLALTRQIDNPEAVPTVPVHKKRHDDEKTSQFVFLRWILAILHTVQLFWNTFVDVLMFLATAIFLKDTITPIKGAPGTELNPRRVAYKMFSLDDMKLVKNAMNATINDVALGITQAGLSRYLNRRYGNDGANSSTKATEERNNLPKKIRLRSVLLINIRPSPGIQVLADMMEKNTQARWGNSVGFVLLPFAIGLCSDPLDYIRQAKATVDRKKNSLEAVCTFYLADIIAKIFGAKAASTLSHGIHSHLSLAFSNVVGPVEEIGFYGHQMAFLAPTSYGQPYALMINFQSYVNKMMVVLSVDEGTIPDPYQLCDDIIESLELVKNAVLSNGLVKDATAPTEYSPPS